MYQAHRLRRVALLGPAFVAAVAYVDPGNVATNVSAGSQFGYTLVWVVVMANLMAMVVQYLSAKLGVVTNHSLAWHVGQKVSGPWRIAYWLQAEGVAIATDLAEVVGGAIALQLLFDLPLIAGAVVTATVSLVILLVGDARGQKPFERMIVWFLGVIAVGFTVGLFVDPPDGSAMAAGLMPTFSGSESVLLASGIIGATVMPHVIYLHSKLTSGRITPGQTQLSIKTLLRTTRVDVVLALILAGCLNLSLLLMAANSLSGLPGTDTLHGVHAVVTSELGAGVALLFAIGLLSSGLASTSVGASAGAEIMHALLRRRIPLAVRRIITVIPALIILAVGVEPSYALVMSQVVLSLGIPFALIPLVLLTSDRKLMGEAVNRLVTKVAAWAISAVVVALNVSLLVLTIA